MWPEMSQILKLGLNQERSDRCIFLFSQVDKKMKSNDSLVSQMHGN